MIIFMIFAIGIVNNNFRFDPQNAISYFDIASKIAMPFIAVFIAVYYSTVTSSYQKISALRSLLSDLSNDRYKIMDAVDKFSTSLEGITSAIRHKARNRYPVGRDFSVAFDAMYEFKKSISSISSALYMSEFNKFKRDLADTSDQLSSAVKNIAEAGDGADYFFLTNVIDRIVVRYQDLCISYDTDIAKEIERLKYNYSKYVGELFI